MNSNFAKILALAVLFAGSRLFAADPHNHADHDHDHDHAAETKPATTPATKPHTHDHDHDHDDHDHDHAPATKPAAPARSHAGHAHDHPHDQGDEARSDEVKLTPEAIKSSGIRIAAAEKRALSQAITAPARIAYDAEAMAHVGSSVMGRVSEVKVKVGQQVSKGDILLVIQSPELGEAQSDLVEKLSLVAVAEAAVGPAQESYERGKKLFEEHQGIAFAEVQHRLALWKTAQGAVIAANAAVVKAKSRLQVFGMDEKSIASLGETGKIDPVYVVRAPITGRVISREATHGELVNPDRDKLLEIADMTKVWAWVDVPEAGMAGVAEGAEVIIRTAIKEPLKGLITHIAPEMDPGTRTAKVRVELANPAGALRVGMFASAEIKIGAAEKGAAVIVIPDEAIQTVEGAPAVFVPVENEPGTFAKREIKIGKSAGGLVEVTAGLKENEKYVAEGSFVLKAELGKAGAEHSH